MSKEYEPIISVSSQDTAPPQDTLVDAFDVSVAWTTVHNMTSATLTAVATAVFSYTKCAKLAYTSIALGNYALFYRALPFIRQSHINFEFALGWGQAATSGDISFSIGQVDNTGATQAMKFQLLAWGTASSTIQIWVASTNTWLTLGTLNCTNLVAGQFVTIKGKLHPADGYAHDLVVGSLELTGVEIPLETEIAQAFKSGLATPGYNMGFFAVEVTNATAATALITYIDRIRVYGSSI